MCNIIQVYIYIYARICIYCYELKNKIICIPYAFVCIHMHPHAFVCVHMHPSCIHMQPCVDPYVSATRDIHMATVDTCFKRENQKSQSRQINNL